MNEKDCITRRESHGMTGSPEYRSWQKMKGRCNDPNNNRYQNYGGRGITICSRWGSFTAFYADMGKRHKRMSIDRIDNDGNYEPDNCKWSTPEEQGRNKRRYKSNKSGCTGVCWNIKNRKWIAQAKCNGKVIYLGIYNDWFEAVCARKSAENLFGYNC